MTLKQLQTLHSFSTDKNSTHTYLDIYDELFAKFQYKPINLIEVGYSYGGSVELWEAYFSEATIFCVDIRDDFKEHSDRVLFNS